MISMKPSTVTHKLFLSITLRIKIIHTSTGIPTPIAHLYTPIGSFAAMFQKLIQCR